MRNTISVPTLRMDLTMLCIGWVMVHPAESVGCRAGNDGYKRMDNEQNNGQHGVQHRLAVVFVRIRTHEEVGYEEDNDNRYQRQLFLH